MSRKIGLQVDLISARCAQLLNYTFYLDFNTIYQSLEKKKKSKVIAAYIIKINYEYVIVIA